MVLDVLMSLSNLALGPVVDAVIDSVEDFAADVGKDVASEALRDLLRRDPSKRARKRALAAFVQELESELVGAGLEKRQIAELRPAVRALIARIGAVEILHRLNQAERTAQVAFASKTSEAWRDINGQPLPADFGWLRFVRRFDALCDALTEADEDLRSLSLFRAQMYLAHAGTTGRVGEHFDVAGYGRALLSRFGRVKIEVLDPNPDHHHVSLDSIFIEPNLFSTDSLLLRALETESTLESAIFESKPELLSTVLVNHKQRLLAITGNPGSGKSAIIAHICVKWALTPESERLELPIPIPVDLRHFALTSHSRPDIDFLDYFESTAGVVWRFSKKEILDLLTTGRCLLLLDGLDEVQNYNSRESIAREAQRMAHAHPAMRAIVTSRILGFSRFASSLIDAGYSCKIIGPFRKEQVEEFVKLWHRAAFDDVNQREVSATRISQSIDTLPSVRDMATNPLLLTLMCLLNRHRELPRDRNTLFDRATSLLLEQWDLTKSIEQDPELERLALDSKDKQRLLLRVAHQMLVTPAGLAENAIEEAELERTIQRGLELDFGYQGARSHAIRIVRQLRERNYILCLLGGTLYGFVHRSFLEFFAAWASVAEYSENAEANRISLDTLIRQTFLTKFQDDRWREVLRLIVARLEPADAERAIRALLAAARNADELDPLWVAADCCGELRSPMANRALLRDVEYRLRDIVEVSTPVQTRDYASSARPVQEFAFSQQNVRALNAISRLPLLAEDSLHWLRLKALSPIRDNIRVAALGGYVRWSGADQVLWHFLLSLTDRTFVRNPPALRVAALRHMAALFVDDATADEFEAIAVDATESREVREAAIQELRRKWPCRANALSES